MAESLGRAPDESAPLVLDEALQQMMHDDQEEWEYEYSNTETETYYLTLELSYPEFKGASAKVNTHSRGGYYKNWQDTPGGGDSASRPSGRTAGAGARKTGTDGDAQVKDEDSSNDEAQPTMAEPDEDDGTSTIDPALRSKGKEPIRGHVDLTRASTTREQTAEPNAEPNAEPTAPADDDASRKAETELRQDIQILELHSDHPLISYRGRLFEGEWAEVIGTEALLVRHDDAHPLPALRRVPGDIDLLGAVSSRIVTKQKIATARQQDRADPLAATREKWNIHIPTGKDRTGARQQQARFLENLMALKKLKGQTDDVTVYALDGAGKDFDDTKDPDYKPRRKRTATAATAAAAAAAAAAGERGGARRGRLAAARRGKQRADVLARPRSTPTPARWEDLDDDEEEDEEVPGDAMDEDEDDDVSLL
ncbi:hypothetical protein V2A60_006783 [Cordyceps javanica]